MKITFTISIFVAVLAMTATTANAKSWRINSDATQAADFASINAAMNSSDVADGDTLYLDPGCGLSSQTVSKQVTIVGPGYLRNDAPYRSATILGDYFYIKAANTKIEGVVISSVLRIMAQYVTIERCNLNDYTSIGYNNSNAQYATIRQCYIKNYIEGYNSGNASYSGYSTIENNIIISSNYYANGSGGVVNNLQYTTIMNNYISATHNGEYYNAWVIGNITSGMIKNNILLNTGKAKNNVLTKNSNTTVINNVMSCAEGTYTNIGDNKYLDSVDESLVFALQGTNDQRYQLKTDSPAKGYATDGGDCGPFGGTYPYVISGLPAGYPYYTNAVIGTRAKDGKINVSLNIKMQNE
jgi:hypothetical protein